MVGCERRAPTIRKRLHAGHPQSAQRGMFSVSDDGEIDLSSTDGLWNWWRHGTQDLDSIAAAAAPSEYIERRRTNDRPLHHVWTIHGSAETQFLVRKKSARATNGLLMTSPGIPMTFSTRKRWAMNAGTIIAAITTTPYIQRWAAFRRGDAGRFAVHSRLARLPAQPALHGNQLNVFHAHKKTGSSLPSMARRLRSGCGGGGQPE